MKKISFIQLVSLFFFAVLLLFSLKNFSIVSEYFKDEGNKDISFSDFASDISEKYKNDFSNKTDMIDINGLFVRAMGQKTSNNILIGTNGYLLPETEDRVKTEEQIKNVSGLAAALKKMDIPYFYCSLPYKVDFNGEMLPTGYYNYTNENVDEFLAGLTSAGVKFLDLRPEMSDSMEHISQYYYKTDHHWTPVGAFFAFGRISEYLQEMFPDEKILSEKQNIENWNINRLENWFLGSQGKRVGKFFGGTDDLIWLTPKFETEMECYVPDRYMFNSGDFTESVIRDKYISTKDYYETNPYCVYIGGDYPLVIHRNRNADVDLKVLILKDSFVLPLQSYFSTVFSQVDVIDLRNYTSSSLMDYIQFNKPDVVFSALTAGSIGETIQFQYGDTSKIYDLSTETAENIVELDYLQLKESNNNYYYKSIYDTLKSNCIYRLSIDSIDVLSGRPEAISISIFNKEANKRLSSYIFPSSSFLDSEELTITFKVPDSKTDSELLLYSGVIGKTKNISVQYNGVHLEKLNYDLVS